MAKSTQPLNQKDNDVPFLYKININQSMDRPLSAPNCSIVRDRSISKGKKHQISTEFIYLCKLCLELRQNAKIACSFLIDASRF